MLDLQNAQVIGFFSMPSTSLQEANPEAYNLAMRDLPVGCGMCQHCGNGIRHHVVIRLADGGKAFIGMDCAEKVGDDAVRRCVREKKTTEQVAQADADREARIAATIAENERRQADEAARLAIRESDFEDILPALDAQKTEFHSSLAEQLRRGSVSNRQAEYIAKAVLGGRRTKRNESLFDKIVDRCMAD